MNMMKDLKPKFGAFDHNTLGITNKATNPDSLRFFGSNAKKLIGDDTLGNNYFRPPSI